MIIRLEIYDDGVLACAVTFPTNEPPRVGEEVSIDFDDPRFELTLHAWKERPCRYWLCDINETESLGTVNGEPAHLAKYFIFEDAPAFS